jgi:hypothetical protein
MYFLPMKCQGLGFAGAAYTLNIYTKINAGDTDRRLKYSQVLRIKTVKRSQISKFGE